MVEPAGSVLGSEVPRRRPKIGRAITTTAARAPSGDESLAGFDDPGPAEPETGGFRAGRAAGGQGGAFPPRQDPGAEEPEHGGQEGERRGHGQGHRDGRGDRQAVQEADAEGELAQQGDADGQAGQEHRAAGGPHGQGGRVGVGQPAFTALRCRLMMNSP